MIPMNRVAGPELGVETMTRGDIGYPSVLDRVTNLMRIMRVCPNVHSGGNENNDSNQRPDVELSGESPQRYRRLRWSRLLFSRARAPLVSVRRNASAGWPGGALEIGASSIH
jgi:hypothetical protein